MRVVECVRETGASFAVATYCHDVSFAIEIHHDDFEALVFSSDEILYGHVYVVEFDEGGSTGVLAAVGNAAHGETWRGGGDDEDGDSTHAWEYISKSCLVRKTPFFFLSYLDRQCVLQ